MTEISSEETIVYSEQIETLPNILQRINQAQRKITGYLQRDREVRQASGTYKVITHDAVTAHIRTAMVEAGIIPKIHVLDKLLSSGQDRKGNVYTRCELHVSLTLINADNPDDGLVMDMWGMGDDYGDKSPGKALSIAVKNLYLKLFLLETGEDEESRAAQVALEAPLSPEQASWVVEACTKLNKPLEAATGYLNAKYGLDLQQIEDIPTRHYPMIQRALQKQLDDLPANA